MKSTLHWLQALLMVLGFLLPQVVRADDAGALAAHPRRTQRIQSAVPVAGVKLRSPKWNNSLQGYGLLNASETPAESRESADSQIGPIRLSQTSEASPPVSFTGSLSRAVSGTGF